LEFLPPNSSRDWGAGSKLTVSVGGEAFEGVNCTKWCIRKVVLMLFKCFRVKRKYFAQAEKKLTTEKVFDWW
jgi:hypothetical protein